METVIFDKETREYMEGWNANMDGKHFLSNPYSCLRYDGELYRLWQQGFEDSQTHWNNGNIAMPKRFSDENIKYAFTITKEKFVCDECNGSGEREIYHETFGDSPVTCMFCEGRGYVC